MKHVVRLFGSSPPSYLWEKKGAAPLCSQAGAGVGSEERSALLCTF